MLKKSSILFFVLLLIFTFVSCSGEDSSNNDTNNNLMDGSDNNNDVDIPINEQLNESAPGSPVNWPVEMLPEGFPNLGVVSNVIDSRTYGKKITIYWNKATQDEVNIIVDKLNEYLDYDHAWQGHFYSDGIKYKQGTQDEFLNIVIRYQADATGIDGDSQFYLEISGEGLPAKS